MSGRFDQTAKVALNIEAGYLLARIAEKAAAQVRYRRMFQAQSMPLPGGIDREADWVPIMDDLDPPDDPEAEKSAWLWVVELQLRDDERKSEVLLAEVANFIGYAKDTDRAGESFRVLPVFVYLTGICSKSVLDHRSGGKGLLCDFVVIEFERDVAMTELKKVERGEAPWGALFWTVLMQGAGGENELALWRRLLDEKVPKERSPNVAYLALKLSELTGCLPAFQGFWEELQMIESTVYKETVAFGEAKGQLRVAREYLLLTLEAKFAGQVPEEYLEIIRKQESFPLLQEWHRTALYAKDVDAFLAKMRE